MFFGSLLQYYLMSCEMETDLNSFIITGRFCHHLSVFMECRVLIVAMIVEGNIYFGWWIIVAPI